MKKLQKLFVLAALILISAGAYSQTSKMSLLGKVGYQTESERFGLEIGGRYHVQPQLRIAPAVSLWFPKNHTMGFDVDANVQYAFPIAGSALDIYPLVGLNMANYRFSHSGVSNSGTEWGVNLGAGLDYSLTSADFLNFEFKYTLGGWDHATFMIGYGYRF